MDLEELTAIARRAVALLDAGQVEVRADRALFVAVRDGRGGRAEATSLDDAALARAAKAAHVHAGRMRAWPVPPLPTPNVRPHRTASVRTDVHRVAVVVASTTGVLAAEAYAEPVPPPAGSAGVPDGACVLGPGAVAAVLHALRNAFGVDAALGGLPDVRLPACLTLVDDGTDRRGFDAEGTPRTRVTLVDAGVPVAHVRDASSAPSTGHATLALTLAPRPDDLRLDPGDADLEPTLDALRPLTGEEALHALTRVVRVGRDGAVELR